MGFGAIAEAPRRSSSIGFWGVEIIGLGVIAARVAGIGMIGVAVACWPGKTPNQTSYGLFAYSTLILLYLGQVSSIMNTTTSA